MYFDGCRTNEDVKARYKELAKSLHPDCGGDAEQFKAMMNEYRKAWDRYKNIHTNAKGETYEKATKQTADEYADIINQIIKFAGCTVEVIGSWIWVSGETKVYREQLKALKFGWSPKKQAWYWHDGEYKKMSKETYSMSMLRHMWGSKQYETDPDMIEATA